MALAMSVEAAAPPSKRSADAPSTSGSERAQGGVADDRLADDRLAEAALPSTSAQAQVVPEVVPQKVSPIACEEELLIGELIYNDKADTYQEDNIMHEKSCEPRKLYLMVVLLISWSLVNFHHDADIVSLCFVVARGSAGGGSS